MPFRMRLHRRLTCLEIRCGNDRRQCISSVDWSVVTDAEFDRLEGVAIRLETVPNERTFRDGLAPGDRCAAGDCAGRGQSGDVMRIGHLHARLDHLAPPARRGRIVVIVPELWSLVAQVAHDAACPIGDTIQSGINHLRRNQRVRGPPRWIGDQGDWDLEAGRWVRLKWLGFR